MAVVFPSETIARRWNGALQARLRRAPVEQFLVNRGIVLAPIGSAQDTDNLVRATLFIVEAGLMRYFGEPREQLSEIHCAVVGHVTCVVGSALAQLILAPAAWRTAALVSTARLLGHRIGSTAAAMASASSVRRFQEELLVPASVMDVQIAESASAAIRETREVSQVAVLIAMRIASFEEARAPACEASPPELQAYS
jgi:hypothetical protein